MSLSLLSAVIGWLYFAAWSISVYPQPILNFRRKDVEGLSIDFTFLNAIGHSSYALYSANFFFNSDVREEYRRRHDGHDNSVQINDVAFACHAATICVFVYLQTLWYPRGATQRLSSFNRGVATAVFVGVIINVGSMISGRQRFIDLLYFLSYFKLYVSFAKFVPQIWLNYKRESTIGFSIEGNLLDLTGGFLSFVQLFIDARIENDWSSITGNPVKLGLAILSILFDLLFCIQHFVLYTDHRDEKLEWRSGGDDTAKDDVESTAAGGSTDAAYSTQGGVGGNHERAPLLG